MSFELAPFDLPEGYGEGIVPLDDVKAWCSIDAGEDYFDDLLGAMRDAGVDMVERYCGVYLAVREGVVYRSEALSSPIDLGVWPISAITSVNWLDGAGELVTGDHLAWRVASRDRLALKPGQAVPSGIAGAVEIAFTAGFETPPAALVTAVKMFAAHLFENREAVSNGSMSGEVPLGFRVQCGAYRMPVI